MTGKGYSMSGEFGISPDGHRFPAGTRLGPVHLQVGDLGRSVGYYQDVLGLEAISASQDRVMLAVPGGGSILLTLREGRSGLEDRIRKRQSLYHFAILMPGRADLGRLFRHLAERRERLGASDHRVSEALYLRDPDGLWIEVYADRPRDQWALQGRELVMSTTPLDTNALLEAAGPVEWEGMPRGATMGHVHLHVGDLAQAESFYHRALGLDKVVWSYPGALFMSAGGYHHHLGVNTWAPAVAAPADVTPGLLEWTLELPGHNALASAAGSLEDAGYRVERETNGDVLTRDPWGAALRLRPQSS